MDSSCLPLAQLEPKNKHAAVSVHVLRKWPYDGNIPGGPILHYGLVLVDKQGTAIYGHIPQHEVYTEKAQKIQENQSYVIKYFEVRTSRENYVPFKGQYMIEFTNFTEVDPTDEPASSFPTYIYNVTLFQDIKTTHDAINKYIDVIGIITSIKAPRTVRITSKETVATIREVTIRDLRENQLVVTLWGDNATNFSIRDVYQEGTPQSVVVLFVGCLPRKIYNSTQVNGYPACRWYFNPQIKEAQPYYVRLSTSPVYIDIEETDDQTAREPVLPIILEEKKLADLNALNPYKFPENGCKCSVTITLIENDNKWWYMACDVCNKKVTLQAGRYICDNRSHHGASARYKLSFVAADDTGDALFFCHDDMARQLLRKSCSQLVGPFQIPDGLPAALTNVINKTFTFGITLSDESFRRMEYRKYKVRSILSHPDIQQIPPQLPPAGSIPPHSTPIAHAVNVATSSQTPSHQQAQTASGSNPSTAIVLATSGTSQEVPIGYTDATDAAAISETFSKNVMNPQTPAPAKLSDTSSKYPTNSPSRGADNVRRALIMPTTDDDVERTTVVHDTVVSDDFELEKNMNASLSEDADISPGGPRKRARGSSTKQGAKTSAKK